MIIQIFKKVLSKALYLLDPVAQRRREGVIIGEGCRFLGNVNFGSEPYLVSLGDRVSITSSSFITHDGGVWVFRDKYPDIDVIAPIKIGSNVFIGSGCTVLPGVNVGDNVVIGAGSMVTKDLASAGVYAGVPAKYVKSIDEYMESSIEKGISSKKMNSEEKRSYLIGLFRD